MISFGTDGWRAVIADTFTFANLHLVSQAVADAINESQVCASSTCKMHTIWARAKQAYSPGM